ncbi:MAG: hypothetical protein MUE34_16775 [Acidimicrobiales bacterium]|nr:hypothetical protein [Acidimicrobiales bacterium]
MIFRRRRAEPVPPSSAHQPAAPPVGELVALRTRARSAAGLVERSAPGGHAAASAARTLEELDAAARNLAETRERLALLDPDRVTNELKAARRRRDDARGEEERRRLDAMVEAAETRFAAVHRLWDRLEAIEQDAEVVVARLEELAASVAVSETTAGATLDRLQDELQALASTYRELDGA